MHLNKHYVLGLALSFALVACGKDEKTKTVTVENPNTVEQLNQAKKERDELAAKLKLADTDTVKLKTDLETANKKVEELTKSLETSEKALTKAKKELADALASETDKVKDLKAKVETLEGQVKTLTESLAKAKDEKAALDLVIKAVETDKAQYQALLEYALQHAAATYDQIRDSLKKDLDGLTQKLADFATTEPVLNQSIADQSKEVLDAKAKLKSDEVDFLKKLQELEAAVTAGTLDKADPVLLALRAYKLASEDLVKLDASKAQTETAIKGLNKDIAALNATLAQSEAELKGFNEQLLALAIAGKLDTPEAKALPAKIDASKEAIAKTTVARDEKVKSLGEAEKKVEALNTDIVAKKGIQTTSLGIYDSTTLNDDRKAVEGAEAELKLRLNALKTAQKDAAKNQADKTRLTGLQTFLNKVKPTK